MLMALIELTHPLMLLFGLAALIPLFIHYWHRQNHIRVRWAATQYLQLALQQTARKFSLRQWILLALRTAILLLLAAVLAAPTLTSRLSLFATTAEATRLRVIVIDRSLSMQAVEQDRPRLEEAKRIASGLVEDAGSNDSFVVLTWARELLGEVPGPLASREQVLAAIDSINGSQHAGRVSDAMASVLELCRRQDFQAFERVELHWISDFTARDWGALPEDTGPYADLAQTVDEVVQHSVCRMQLSNNSVVGVSALQSVPVVDRPFPLEVEVRNFGATAEQRLAVELLVNGQRETSRSVDLPANGKVNLRFELLFDQPGEKRIEARIGEDSLLADNRRFQIIDCRPGFRVLFLEGRNGGSRFLRLALEPDPDDDDSLFRSRTCGPDELAALDLEQFDVIFWDNVRGLEPAASDRLKRFVSQGGRLVMFLGDLVDRPQFNQTWNEREPSIGLQLQSVSPVESYQVDPLEYRSPFLEAFRGNPQAGLAEMPIWTYYRVRPDPRTWTIGMALANGDPLLLSRRMGPGTIVLFTSSASSESRNRSDPAAVAGVAWNANETLPVFPPLIQEIFFTLIGIPVDDSIRVGETAAGQLEVRSRVGYQELEALKEADTVAEDIEVDIRQADGLVSWRSEPLNQAGFYRLTLRHGQQEFTRSLAVNLDPVESDLRTVELEDTTASRMSRETASRETASDFSGDRSGWRFYQVLLLTLLALLLLETFLGFRMGQGNV